MFTSWSIFTRKWPLPAGSYAKKQRLWYTEIDQRAATCLIDSTKALLLLPQLFEYMSYSMSGCYNGPTECRPRRSGSCKKYSGRLIFVPNPFYVAFTQWPNTWTVCFFLYCDTHPNKRLSNLQAFEAMVNIIVEETSENRSHDTEIAFTTPYKTKSEENLTATSFTSHSHQWTYQPD